MRRKTVGSLGTPKPLALATSKACGNVLPFPVVSMVTPALSQSPPAMTVGSTALAVQPLPLEEPARSEDYPSRPSGVTDEVLLEAWHRLHCPVASVAGSKKKDGTIRRVNHASSGIHRPKAYAATHGDVVQLNEAHVVSLYDHVSRLCKSANSRYLSDHKIQPVDLINPKAEAYVLDCFKHRVSVWQGVVDLLSQKAASDHKDYSFSEVVELRKLERADEPPPPWVEPMLDRMVELPAANDDASIEYVAPPFVGPRDGVICREDVPVRSWDSYIKTRAYYHGKKLRELTESFNAHDYKQNVSVSKYRRSLEMLSCHEDIPEGSYVAYAKTQKYYHDLKQKMYEELWEAEEVRLKNVKLLAHSYALFKRNKKWRATKEFMSRMKCAFNEYVNSSALSATHANEKAIKRTYKLKAYANKNKTVSSYQPLSFVGWVRLVTAGHSLPGNQKFLGPVKSTAISDQALSRIFSRVVASVVEAKAAIRKQVADAMRCIHNGMRYELSDGGVLLPEGSLIVVPLENNW